MAEIPTYIPIVMSLIGGGLAGSIVTNIVTTYRSRLQPVGYRIEIAPVLRSKPESTSLPAKITIEHQGTTHSFGNLFIARIQILNQGNRDLSEFNFGITLASGDTAIHIEGSGPDRHHTISALTPVTPASTTREVDLRCTPFNRGDAYTLNAFIVAGNTPDPGELQISSSLPVKFSNIPTFSEIALRTSSLSLSLLRLLIKS
jgi:hypothetical protein